MIVSHLLINSEELILPRNFDNTGGSIDRELVVALWRASLRLARLQEEVLVGECSGCKVAPAVEAIVWVVILALRAWVVALQRECLVRVVPFVNLFVDHIIKFVFAFLLGGANLEDVGCHGVELAHIVWLPL